jgi:FlaG/FlaF family flagellin (archaellin)
MRSISRRISPSLIIALVALFITLAGTAAASTVIGSKPKSRSDSQPQRTLKAIPCESGAVLGFARVKGGASTPAFYTSNSAVIDITRNCTGGSVQVRRSAPGVYFVRFVNDPASLALVSVNQDGASTQFSGDSDNVVSVGKITSGSDAGSFRVDVQDLDPAAPDGHKPQDGKFTIMIP